MGRDKFRLILECDTAQNTLLYSETERAKGAGGERGLQLTFPQNTKLLSENERDKGADGGGGGISVEFRA